MCTLIGIIVFFVRAGRFSHLLRKSNIFSLEKKMNVCARFESRLANQDVSPHVLYLGVKAIIG